MARVKGANRFQHKAKYNKEQYKCNAFFKLIANVHNICTNCLNSTIILKHP